MCPGVVVVVVLVLVLVGRMVEIEVVGYVSCSFKLVEGAGVGRVGR